MREQIPTVLSDIAGWISFDLAWTQRYAVTTLCRMLFTLETGRGARLRPPRSPQPGSLARTMAFADHARELARRRSDSP